MIYKIASFQDRTSTSGKKYSIVYFTDPQGAQVKASWWEMPPHNIGDTVEGDLITKGDFTNFRAANAPQRNSGRSRDIQVATEIKQQGIRVAQENKETGIKVAGAMRDATLVTLQMMKDQPFPTDAEFKEAWRNWRDWFMNEYSNESDRLKNQPF